MIIDATVNPNNNTRRALRAAKSAKRPVGRNRALFDNKTGNIIGVNVGTAVRPEVIPVDPNTGIESVEMFLARGGSIVKCAPCTRGQKKQTVRVTGASSYSCGDRGRGRFGAR